MTPTRKVAALLVLGLAVGVTPTAAQEPQDPRAPTAAQEPPEPRAPGWSALRVAKWSTTALAAAAAAYGFTMNRRGDARYEELERACLADPFACGLREPDGSYRDAELEARYQEVRRLDGRARDGLLASQVGVAVSVVLFVLDLRNARSPDDILYEPRRVEVRPHQDGGLELRLRLPVPATRAAQPTS